jgi:hypothetical protein
LNGLARTEADHAPTRLLHEICSPGICLTLERVVLPVDFDDKLSCDAREVCEEGSDGMLAPELQAAHAVCS